MSDFSQIADVEEPTSDLTLTLGGLGDYVPWTGRSGKVPPGLYPLKWGDAGAIVKKASEKAKGDHTIQHAMSIVGPDFAGTTIIKHAAAPTERSSSDQGYQDLRGALRSIWSKDPETLEAAKKKSTMKVHLKKSFAGKVAYAELSLSDDEEYDNSQVERWITYEEYKAAPGPFDKTATAESGKASPKQKGTPDAFEDGGNSKGDDDDEIFG